MDASSSTSQTRNDDSVIRTPVEEVPPIYSWPTTLSLPLGLGPWVRAASCRVENSALKIIAVSSSVQLREVPETPTGLLAVTLAGSELPQHGPAFPVTSL